MYSTDEKLTSLKIVLTDYFKSEDFILNEVSVGRTNLNYFLSFS